MENLSQNLFRLLNTPCHFCKASFKMSQVGIHMGICHLRPSVQCPSKLVNLCNKHATLQDMANHTKTCHTDFCALREISKRPLVLRGQISDIRESRSEPSIFMVSEANTPLCFRFNIFFFCKDARVISNLETIGSERLLVTHSAECLC